MQISWGSMIHLWILTDECWDWYIGNQSHWEVIREPLMIRDANRQEDELRQDKRCECLCHCGKWKCASARERDQERCYLTMVSSASSSLILFSFMSIWERRTLACSVASLVCRRRSHFSLSSMSFSLARVFTASSLSCSTAQSASDRHTHVNTHTLLFFSVCKWICQHIVKCIKNEVPLIQNLSLRSCQPMVNVSVFSNLQLSSATLNKKRKKIK